MRPIQNVSPHTVKNQGAPAGSVLCGSGISNGGLRLRIVEKQPPGRDGPIQGAFVILDAGNNRHARALAALLGRTTNAAEVLAVIRREHTACVNVANTNVLTAEQEEQAQPR
jgi:hypothetical protein